jgi:transposase
MRYEPTDHEWTGIRPMLPNKPRVNDRRILNGIFWVLRSGAPWRDLPEIFGPCVQMTLVSIVICQAYVWLRYF